MDKIEVGQVRYVRLTGERVAARVTDVVITTGIVEVEVLFHPELADEKRVVFEDQIGDHYLGAI